MRKVFIAIPFLLLNEVWAGEVSMARERWEAPETAVFREHRGRAAMELKGGVAVLKETVFRDGTIEFDLEPLGAMGPGVGFRRRDAETYEYFYLRPAKAATAWDGCQYAPVFRGVLIWDLLPEHQGPAGTREKDWNHVKLVVAGARMKVYVNGELRLEVGALRGESREGGILLQGPAIFANLVIREDETEGLRREPEADTTAADRRLVRKWEMSEVKDLGASREVEAADLPGAGATWQPIEAERGGLVNLTRRLGQPAGRPVVWVRTTIESDVEQVKRAALGWNDEVWIFVNGRLVYTGKNLYRKPELRKEPEGRCALGNGDVDLPLRKGRNEIVVAVAKEIFGWGLVLQLADEKGVKLR
ncbi:MAG: DUF1080 domain-containing protein [Bryobacter sp.]|jgi:hypothetical protein|nr:DUF1080 domain-containing protein [Bryobacter sp. CoA8 C33]